MVDPTTRRDRHPWRHGPICWMLCLIVIHLACGCSTNPSESSDTEGDGLAVETIDEIRSAIDRCRGTLRCDEQGRPIEVDLLRGRASADAAALNALKASPDIKILRARLGQLAASQLSIIGSLSNLEELYLQDAAIDDSTLIGIAVDLPHLRRLTLRNAPRVTDRAIIELAKRFALTQLALIDLQITGQSVKQIAAMATLVSLDLRMCHAIGSEELPALSTAPKLQDLKLGGPAIDNAVLAVVAALPHLQRLTIEDALIDGAGISHLADDEATAKRLESLAFARCSALTDDQLHSLEAFPNLRQLTLRDVPTTGMFLQSFLTDKLELLSLNQTFLVEEAFERIATFRNLRRLDLAQNILTLRAMEHIGELTELRYLDLTDCAISDALLEPLASLPKLETIIVAGNPDVSREAVARLRGQCR